jgi:short-subunit dehydrogenase
MQRVIIIGATSGIGKELAKLYTQHGNRVGITGRRQELLDTLQHEFPEQISTECFDVTGPYNIPHLESLINKLGGLDVLIYSSGFGDASKTLDWEIEKRTTLTNVNGFVEIVAYAFNYFVNQGHGQIAGISSIASIRGNSAAPAYSASKAYMSTYLEGLNVKAKKIRNASGIKPDIAITDIQPGFVDTKLAKSKMLFWVAPVEKAAKQIYRAIMEKRRRVYITRRWAIIAWLVRGLPYFIYKRFA